MQNLSLQQNFFIKMGNVTRGELALQHDPTSSPRHVPVKGPLVCADFLLVLCRWTAQLYFKKYIKRDQKLY